jgi:hypothetical protein
MLQLNIRRLAPLLLLLAPGCGRRVSEAECVSLLDRYTEALARQENPEASPESIARMKDAARVRARHDERFDFARCSAEVSRRQYDCAMSAFGVDAMERCLVL